MVSFLRPNFLRPNKGGTGDIDINLEILNSDVSGVFSGKGDLALREPMTEHIKATASFARALDRFDEENVVHTPCAKSILVEVPRFQNGARKRAAPSFVEPEIANPTSNVGTPDVAAGNPASIGGSSNDAAGQDAHVAREFNEVNSEIEAAHCSLPDAGTDTPSEENTREEDARDSELTRLWKAREPRTHEDIRFDSEEICFAGLDWSMLNVWDFFDTEGYAKHAADLLPAILKEPGEDIERELRTEKAAPKYYMPCA